MLVPFYNPRKPDEVFENNTYKWIDLKVFLNVLDDDIINKFKDLSAFNLDEVYNWKYDNIIKNMNPINIDWDNFIDFKTFLIASKVFFTTWFTCKYWYWKKWEITSYGYPHHWIDLILPKNTPITSFSDWEVYDIKNWDWVKKDEWNCVVIKSEINWEILYFCYEHLEKISVKKWDTIKKWENIWTCGETWNATTYHLHFQIDTDKANFHPFWNKWENSLMKTYENCIDPWDWLRKNYDKNTQQKITKKETTTNNNSDDIVSAITNELKNKTKENKTKLISYKKEEKTSTTNNNKKEKNNTNTTNNNNTTKKPDIIENILNNISDKSSNNNDYINFFINAWILKWDHWDYLLNSNLTRFQFVLIINRLNKSWLIQLENKDCNIKFTDIAELKNDNEFMEWLKLVVCNHILTWDNWRFLAWDFLTWEQFLAIIWRIFWKLQNWKNIWYQPYFEWALKNNYINKNWNFIWKPITRKEVFSILFKIFNS